MDKTIHDTPATLLYRETQTRHDLVLNAVKALDEVERVARREMTAARLAALVSWPCPVCDAHSGEKCSKVTHPARWAYVEEHEAMTVRCGYCEAAPGVPCKPINGDDVHKHREMLSGVLGDDEQERACDYMLRRAGVKPSVS